MPLPLQEEAERREAERQAAREERKAFDPEEYRRLLERHRSRRQTRPTSRLTAR